MTVYACNLHVATGLIDRCSFEADDDHGVTSGADLMMSIDDEIHSVYADSSISQADADRKVLARCEELRDGFARAVVLLGSP